MSEETDWTPSNEEYVELESDELSFSTGLRETTCEECGRTLSWQLVPDPDSTIWEAQCCEHSYHLKPVKLRAFKLEGI